MGTVTTTEHDHRPYVTMLPATLCCTVLWGPVSSLLPNLQSMGDVQPEDNGSFVRHFCGSEFSAWCVGGLHVSEKNKSTSRERAGFA